MNTEQTSPENARVFHVVIVGGGAAAWLSANHLGSAIRDARNTLDKLNTDISVTLIESPNIPKLTVGEGTVPSIRQSLQYFGISETDLFTQCSATFKQSIEFVNWQTASQHTPHRYHHVFDYPKVANTNAIADWVSSGYQQASFDNTFSVQANLIEKGLAPKTITHSQYEGACNYAYHFDAAGFSKLLAQNAVDCLHVKHRFEEIKDVIGDKAQGISYLLTEKDEQIHGDLFIDCTGAKSMLLGTFFQTEFVSKSDQLFTDTALATHVRLPDSRHRALSEIPANQRPKNHNANQDNIPCSTLATAHSAGWIWDIPLQDRRGVGIVYSSAHINEAQALATLREYLGDEVFTGYTSEPKKIPMQAGYYNRAWVKNCVAIGMSQGFVEPLEATGLLMFDKSAHLLSSLLLDVVTSENETLKKLDKAKEQFNTQLTQVWEGVFDFIKLHYCISHRQDSGFWQAHQDQNTWSENLKTKMHVWRTKLPEAEDFHDSGQVFNLANHVYVLFGMDARPNLSDSTSDAKVKHESGHLDANTSAYHLQQMHAEAEHLSNTLQAHKTLIDKIKLYGMQHI